MVYSLPKMMLTHGSGLSVIIHAPLTDVTDNTRRQRCYP